MWARSHGSVTQLQHTGQRVTFIHLQLASTYCEVQFNVNKAGCFEHMSWKTTLGNAAAKHATLLLLTEELLFEDASALHLLPGVELQPAARQ
jgi:hypothetical protein